MHPQSTLALERLSVIMQSREYAPRSITSYVQECRFLFSFYPEKTPTELTQDDIARYIVHIKAAYGVGRDKVRMELLRLKYGILNFLPLRLVLVNWLLRG